MLYTMAQWVWAMEYLMMTGGLQKRIIAGTQITFLKQLEEAWNIYTGLYRLDSNSANQS